MSSRPSPTVRPWAACALLVGAWALTSCALFRPVVVEVEVPVYVERECSCCLPPMPALERVSPDDPHAAACYGLDDADALASWLEAIYLEIPTCACGD